MMPDQTMIDVQTQWDKALVPANTPAERLLLIEVCAQDLHKRQRTREPVNFSLVIDRSGSMGGWRLKAVKTAAAGIVGAMHEEDQLSLVAFDNTVTRHLGGVTMDKYGRQQAQREIECLTVGNTTNLSAGWLEGAKCAAETIDQNKFQNGYVLVLSDGKANQGIISPIALSDHARELSHRGIQSSSVGIGSNYSPLQLDAIAEGGRGRLHDAETPDDIIDIVLGELGEVRSLATHDTELNVKSPRGVRIELLNRATARVIDEGLQVDLGTLLANRPQPVALLAEVPPLPAGSQLHFELTVTWRDSESGTQYRSVPVNSTLRVVPPEEAAAVERDHEVVRRIADLWEAALAYHAMRYNEEGDFVGAINIYQDNLDKFSAMIRELEDADIRTRRLSRARRAVGQSWHGRSKRDALAMSKKMMLNEADLRRRDSGDWHDFLR